MFDTFLTKGYQAAEKRPAYRQAGICVVALVLPRVKHGAGLLQRTSKYASLLRISGALPLGIFEQPDKNYFSSRPLDYV